MPSAAHEALVAALDERPELLALLVEKLLGQRLPGPLTSADSTLRFADPDEVRPDLVLRAPDGAWVIVEVQGSVDAEKPRRWLLAMAAMFNETSVAGDLLVITHERRIATWVEHSTRIRGPLGTGLALEPMVLLVAGRVVDALLDEAHPELAFLAAWAMQHRHGREAVRVVRRAFELSARLDDDLQGRRWRGILNVLSGTILEKLEELRMRRTEVPLRPEVRKLWEVIEEGQKRRKLAVAQGKAEGVLGSLLIVLKARSLALSAAQRARIGRCRDAEKLQRWLERAVSATRADEVFE